MTHDVFPEELQRGFGWYVLRVWLILASIVTVAVFSLATGYAIVQSLSGDGRAVRATNVRVTTVPIRALGELKFEWDYEVIEACPRDLIFTFQTPQFEGGETVTMRRPVVRQLLRPRVYADLGSSIVLPPSVVTGSWRVSIFAESKCPNRTQTDLLTEFTIDVVK